MDELDKKFKEEKNFRKLIETIKEGIILIDEDNSIFYNNRATSKIFSFD
jgi:PAS domain S-box-containing protein